MTLRSRLTKAKVEHWFRICLWCLLILMCIPFIGAAGCAVFSADDFSIVLGVEYENIFKITMQREVSSWLLWQGTWFSNFVANFFHPLFRGGETLLRVSLVIILIAAFLGLTFLCYALTVFFGIKKKFVVYINALILMPILFYYEYYEMYLWWTGAAVYLVPLVVLEIGVAVMLLGAVKRKRWMLILASILCLLMSGGVLTNAGFGCFVLLLFVVGRIIKEKKVDVYLMIPFLSALAGAVFNAAAPGNYIRQSNWHTDLNIFRAAAYSVFIIFQRLDVIIHRTTFIAFLLFAVLFGTVIKKKLTVLNMLYVLFGTLLTPVVTVFPLVLAQGLKKYGMANRLKGSVDISIYSSLVFLFICIGAFLTSFIKEGSRQSLRICACLTGMLVLFTFGDSYNDMCITQIALNFANGSIKEYSQDWENIFNMCKEHPGENLVIEYDLPERKPGFAKVELSSDPTFWINTCVARHYNLESVALVEPEDDQ